MTGRNRRFIPLNREREARKQLDSFASWLAHRLPELFFSLDIAHSRYVPGGINARCRGVEEVLSTYRWNQSDWPETRLQIQGFRRELKSATVSGQEDRCLEVCLQIIEWGGNRNSEVGAIPFLRAKAKKDSLIEYLVTAKEVLTVQFPISNGALKRVQLMNSMLTKVHAFNADDGLPIYDSRVAFAAAAFVELYRR